MTIRVVLILASAICLAASGMDATCWPASNNPNRLAQVMRVHLDNGNVLAIVDGVAEIHGSPDRVGGGNLSLAIPASVNILPNQTPATSFTLLLKEDRVSTDDSQYDTGIVAASILQQSNPVNTKSTVPPVAIATWSCQTGAILE